MVFQIVLILCCVYIIKFLLKKRKLKITEPPEFSGAYPLIGHSWKLIGDQKHVLEHVKSLSKETLEKGGVITWNVGSYLFYALSDPDDCAKVANECLDKDYFYNFAKPFLGNGLTVAEVPLWKVHRKKVRPAFRQQNLNSFLVVFNRQAKRLVNHFKNEVGRGPFNVDDYIRLNSLESICMTSFGADVTELDGIHRQYLEAVNEIQDIFTERFQKFWLHNDIVYNWSSLKRRQDYCVERILNFSGVILAKRKSEMKRQSSNTDENDIFTPFMSYFLELSKETDSYTEQDILYETNTMVGAGYDTSTVSIILILMLLGSHPEVQTKVYEELQQVLGNSDRDVSKDDISLLLYLDGVINETLRLYPVAPIIARRIEKDVHIKNYTLKAGNGVSLLFWAMHRHPMWGPDAEMFRPERWLDGSLPNNPNAFGGFSLGKRACIGKTYAMMSLKTTILHVVRSFKISADINKLQLELHGALKVTDGQLISIEKRV